jgi:hypothetical protein
MDLGAKVSSPACFGKEKMILTQILAAIISSGMTHRLAPPDAILHLPTIK